MAEALTSEKAKPLGHPEHLQILSEELVQLWRRPEGWPRRLMVFMPPRHGKSETCSKWFPAWNLALEPETKVILCSYADEIAADFGRKTRRIIEDHLPVLGVRLMEDSRAVHRWETKDGGGMTTAGVGGPIAGKGGDLLIVDDPVKNAEEAQSPKIKQNVWDWYTTTFLTRGETADTLMVLIMTRWAVDDLAGRILETEEAKLWRVISLPGMAEKGDPLGRERHEPLWPDRGFDKAFYETRKKEMGPVQFGALYQQRPVPEEGMAVPEDWWRWYTEAPKEFDEIILTWDTTFKDLATSDFVCGGALGRAGADYYLLDIVHDRMNMPDATEAVRAMKYRFPTNRAVLIEESANGAAIIQVLAHEIPGIVPIPPVGNKIVRLHWAVNSVAGLIKSGHVHLPEGSRYAEELVKEFRDFPAAQYDDYVDMMTQGLNFLQPRGWTFEARQARRVEPPKTSHEAMSRDFWDKIHKRFKDIEKNQPAHLELPGF
jgi:predicted phage terminase large subunit-like protein